MLTAAIRPIRRSALLLAVAGSAMSGAASLAQSTWAVPGTGGSWNLAANWSPLGIPNSAGAQAVLPTGAPYTVSLDGNVVVNAITIAAPATMSVSNSVQLTFNSPSAGITNNGTFVLNTTAGSNGTYLQLQNTDCTLSGSGQLVLNAQPTNLDTAQVAWWGGGERLINGVQHTIRGTGRIRTYFTNDGTLNANAANSTLWLTDQNKINNGTMKAGANGTLYVNCRFDQSASATMRADTDGIVYVAGSVYGGSIGSTGNGVVQFASSSIGSNTLFGQVKILDAQGVYVENSDLVNNGTLTVNATAGVNAAFLGLRNGPTNLSGSGTLRLNANAANLDTAQIVWWGGGEILTNAPGHSIKGSGRIRTSFVNQGTVTADVPGQSLWLSDRAKTNNAIMEATGGGNLYINADVSQGPAGIIRCDSGSSISIAGIHVDGGTITSAPGAATTVTGSAGFSSTPTLNGSMLIPDGHFAYFEASGMVNNGVITVNPSSGIDATGLVLRNGDATFSGPGTILMKANAGNLDTAQIVWWGGAETLNNTAAHTIRGTGRIRTGLLNQGTVSADSPGLSLWLSDRAKTNNNLMRATAGGDLYINCAVAQSDSARIVAENGSSVQMNGASVGGGLVQSNGSGVVRAMSNTHLQTLTTNSDFRIPTNHTVYVDGGSTITNNGTIKLGDINDTAGGSGLTAFNGDISLIGTGNLLLSGAAMNSDSAAVVWWSGGEVVTNGATHTVHGVGRIRTSYVNEGLTSADTNGGALWLSDRGKINHGTMRATNGGTLLVNCGLTQEAGGQMQAMDGSVIAFVGSTIQGGALGGGTTGYYTMAGNSYLQTLTNNSVVKMLPGNTTFSTNATITNNGTIKVGDSVSTSGTTYVLQNGDTTLTGNGTMLLDAPVSNTDLVQISWWGGGEVLTNSAGHTIGGTGRIRNRVVNNGNITPGKPGTEIGTISMTDRSVTFGATSRLNIQVASATSFDAITGNAALTLGGNLQIRLLNGYTGGIGTTYEIVHGSSITGTFNLIDIPDHPTIGLKYGVQYTSNSVLLRVTCDVDFNSDGVIDLFDYLDFVDVFSTGVPDADFNADGVVDLFDYLDFLDQFAHGCD